MESLPMENRNLLFKNNEAVVKLERNGQVLNGETSREPPDGGFRAYMIIVGSFLTNGLIFGVINSYSVIYTVLQERLKNENVPNSETRACEYYYYCLYSYYFYVIICAFVILYYRVN